MKPIPASIPSVRPCTARRGFSLVELLVVMAVLTMAVGMFSSTLVSTSRQSRIKREQAIAAEAARQALERMRSLPCGQLFATYNAAPGDDPGGAGTAAGQGFAVPGIEGRPGPAEGLAARIVFPTIGAALREDSNDASLGMPRDLDGAGAVDASDHASDYLLLPAHVRIEWRGAAGDSAFD